MMWIVNSAISRIFEIAVLPFRQLSPWFAMAWLSLLTGILMLFIFRWTSNQEGIKKTKDRIKAHLLELRLFKDNLGISLQAQGQILRQNLKYIGYSARPMAVMIIPLLLILVQLNLRFGSDSLRIGESALVKIKLQETANPMEVDIALETSPGLVLETPALRIEEDKEIDWRVRAQAKGVQALTFKLRGQSFTKAVAVEQAPVSKISALRVSGRVVDEALNPGEKPLPRGIPVKSIEVAYPSKRMSLFGLNLHWLIVYLILSIGFGFALKRPFKVEV